jgi:hypothetical protein
MRPLTFPAPNMGSALQPYNKQRGKIQGISLIECAAPSMNCRIGLSIETVAIKGLPGKIENDLHAAAAIW